MATALRRMAAASFAEAGRLAVMPCNVKAAKQGVFEAAVMRKIAASSKKGRFDVGRPNQAANHDFLRHADPGLGHLGVQGRSHLVPQVALLA